MLEYNPHLKWEDNVAERRMHHVGRLQEMVQRRDKTASGPNHPELKSMDVAAKDAAIDVEARHFAATDDGCVYHDSSDPTTCSPVHQRWVAEARKRGRLKGPQDFEPSLHDELEQPLRVIRGNGNTRAGLGSPATITR